MIVDELYKTLKSLPQSVLEAIIFKLMCDGKIEFHNITKLHIAYLQELRKGQSKHYQDLVSKIVDMHTDNKKNLKSNLGGIMHYLLDCGEVNMTHEDIDKRYG